MNTDPRGKGCWRNYFENLGRVLCKPNIQRVYLNWIEPFIAAIQCSYLFLETPFLDDRLMVFSVCLVWLVSFEELFVTNTNVDIALFGQRHQNGDYNVLLPTHPCYTQSLASTDLNLIPLVCFLTHKSSTVCIFSLFRLSLNVTLCAS